MSLARAVADSSSSDGMARCPTVSQARSRPLPPSLNPQGILAKKREAKGAGRFSVSRWGRRARGSGGQHACGASRARLRRDTHSGSVPRWAGGRSYSTTLKASGFGSFGHGPEFVWGFQCEVRWNGIAVFAFVLELPSEFPFLLA